MAAPAPAAVDVGPERIIVTGDGASAIVERAALRRSFAGPDGRPALQRVANERGGPFPIPATPDPEPLGGDDV